MDMQGEIRHLVGGPSIQITVRRNYLYEDAFEKLSLENGQFHVLILRFRF